MSIKTYTPILALLLFAVFEVVLGLYLVRLDVTLARLEGDKKQIENEIDECERIIARYTHNASLMAQQINQNINLDYLEEQARDIGYAIEKDIIFERNNVEKNNISCGIRE